MKISRLLDWIIIIIGLLSTSLVTFYVSEKNRSEDQLRFNYETNVILRRIQTRMQNYESALIELRAFLRNSPDLSRETIQNFIKDTELIERLPGIQGIGYTQIFSKRDLDAHIKLMKKSIPGYHIHPPGDHEIYSSIILLEPQDWRNKRAIGYNMYAEPVRRRSMDEARDSDTAVMSDPIILVQEVMNERLLGFNLYLPHYKKGADISTEENRRKALIGFLYSPFRAHDLFQATFQDLKMVLDVEVYGGEFVKDKLYFDYHEDHNGQDLVKFSELLIHGRKLLIKTTPLPAFGLASSMWKTCLVFLFGTFMTFVIYYIYFTTRRQMHNARMAEQEKEKLLQKEKEHVAARDDFLSIASHELKTPLTSLKLQSQVVMRSIAKNDQTIFTPEKVTNLVKQIDTQTTRLTRLVDDMLDISRIRTGRLKIEKETVDLTELILDVTERLKPQFLQVTGETPVLEIQENIKGSWDRFRIEQVLTNLLTNAIRYGNNKTVTIKTAVENNHARICVIDHGIGIAKENIDKIFQRFERAGMSASEISGLGLGLFITSQIIRAHGGTIHVESDLGKGSTFIVELPLST